jgi:hypothetical protein
VYSREIDGRILTIVPSGWTYKNTFVLYDKETQTLWYPYEKGLMGIQGKYFQKWLPIIASQYTKWRKWKKSYPDTRVLY